LVQLNNRSNMFLAFYLRLFKGAAASARSLQANAFL
jgi:hypothetical protein